MKTRVCYEWDHEWIFFKIPQVYADNANNLRMYHRGERKYMQPELVNFSITAADYAIVFNMFEKTFKENLKSEGIWIIEEAIQP